jgi:type III pantothenate kinase
VKTHLVLDFGNTRIKAAVFKNGKISELHFFKDVHELLRGQSLIESSSRIMLATVTNQHLALTEKWSKKKEIITFNNTLSIPLKNRYESPDTLGHDRLLASIGAFSLYPNKPVLVMDFGTCIKYNFTNEHNEFLGGAISPGLEMRYKALNHFTEKLPLLSAEYNYNQLIGNNTINSIHSGVITGVLKETEGIINEYKQIYPNLICLGTGGDSDFFAKRLKNSIFAEPDLVLKGLYHVLITHLEN